MRIFACLLCMFLVVTPSRATVILFHAFQGNPTLIRQQWLAAAPVHEVIDFTGYPEFTILNTQYANQGILFADGTDRIDLSSIYIEDGAGLNGALDESTLVFTQPTYTLAFDHPGSIRVALYSGNQLIYDSGQLVTHGPGLGHFAGFISDQPFDRAEVSDGGLFIDNIYFGPAVPAPGSVALLALSSLAVCSRRRRS